MGPTERTEETVAARFPDRGEPPSNEVVVDPAAPDSPNIGHPAHNVRPDANHWSAWTGV